MNWESNRAGKEVWERGGGGKYHQKRYYNTGNKRKYLNLCFCLCWGALIVCEYLFILPLPPHPREGVGRGLAPFVFHYYVHIVRYLA